MINRMLHRLSRWLSRWLLRYRRCRQLGLSPKLELFATSQTDGWDCIGGAINGEDIRVALARIIAEQEDLE